MSHLLPLSRVSKLIGISRHALQEMVRSGTLDTFDGMIELEEMLRAFPDTKWENDAEFRRVTEIKEKAFGKRVFERALPDKEVLAARLAELGNEYASSQAMLLHYSQVLSWLDEKIDEIAEDKSKETVHALHTLRSFLLRQLNELPPEAAKARAAIAQERIMKIMSAHVTIRPSGHEFFVEGSDTLLEAALRAGVSLEYGCSNGNCGECSARLISGKVMKIRAHDYVLRQDEKDAGMILLCSCAAVNDVVIEANVAGAHDIQEQHLEAKVKSVEVFNPDVASLHLLTPRSQRLRFLAGQSMLLSANGVNGHYAIASCPCEDRHIEFQVLRSTNDTFSDTLFNNLKANDLIELHGPYGEFVLEDSSSRPVVFVAFGVGFAPIKSLIQHSMSLDLAEAMDLHWFADKAGHYQNNLCRSWADAMDNFRYFPHILGSRLETSLADIVAEYPDIDRYDVYAAGTEEQLQTAKRVFVERGLPEQQWRSGVLEL